MPLARVPRSLYFAVVPLLILTSLPASPRGQSQANDQLPQSEAPFHLKVASNLVVVRVRVRDAQGKPVEGLQRADFHLFDRGKEQTIAQFEAEISAPEAPSPAAAV